MCVCSFVVSPLSLIPFCFSLVCVTDMSLLDTLQEDRYSIGYGGMDFCDTEEPEEHSQGASLLCELQEAEEVEVKESDMYLPLVDFPVPDFALPHQHQLLHSAPYTCEVEESTVPGALFVDRHGPYSGCNEFSNRLVLFDDMSSIRDVSKSSGIDRQCTGSPIVVPLGAGNHCPMFCLDLSGTDGSAPSRSRPAHSGCLKYIFPFDTNNFNLKGGDRLVRVERYAFVLYSPTVFHSCTANALYPLQGVFDAHIFPSKGFLNTFFKGHPTNIVPVLHVHPVGLPRMCVIGSLGFKSPGFNEPSEIVTAIPFGMLSGAMHYPLMLLKHQADIAEFFSAEEARVIEALLVENRTCVNFLA